ncbi:MAG: hypothetical protein ACR2RF_14360 [Geminicoccaceae bacterium]
MADLTKQGRWRTDLAMRQLALTDYEATGQYPKPYKPHPTLGLGKRAAIATMKGGWFLTKATAKGGWWLTRKAFAASATPEPRQRSASWRHGRPRITIIEIWDVAPGMQVLRIAAAILLIVWAASATGFMDTNWSGQDQWEYSDE